MISTVFAQVKNVSIPGLSSFMGKGGVGFLQAILRTAITVIFAVGFLYFFFILLTGGIDWIRSGSDKAQLEAARGKLSSAFIGLLLLIAAYGIVKLLEAIFGISILNFIVPSLRSQPIGIGVPTQFMEPNL